MEYNDDKFIEHPDQLLIDDEMKAYLDEYGRWGKILAIISFVSIGLVVIGVVLGFLYMSMAEGGFGGSSLPIPEMFLVLIYLLFLVIYFIPALYLYRSTTAVRKAVRLDDDFALVESFRNLKNLFKFLAIFILIGIGLYALMIVAVLIFGAGSFLGF